MLSKEIALGDEACLQYVKPDILAGSSGPVHRRLPASRMQRPGGLHDPQRRQAAAIESIT